MSTEKDPNTGAGSPPRQNERAPSRVQGPLFEEELPVHQARLREVALPKRSRWLHWTAFVLSLAGVGILVGWEVSHETAMQPAWFWLDAGIALLFIIEFFTRSGMRWNPLTYMASRFFDFVAMVPALVLVHFNVPLVDVWVWVVLSARAIRAIDRLLGDGFFKRNALALVEGIEEELTDRVLLRIIVRLQEQLYHGSFAHELATVLWRNKASVLERVRAAHPKEGLAAGIARIAGLDAVLERAEEQTFDAIVGIVDSPEVDKAVREAVDSAFVVLKKEIGVKTWRQRIGIKHATEDSA